MNSGRALKAVLMCLALCLQAAAQDLAQFEVVSIKRHVTLEASGGIRTLPDGTMIMVNQPIASLIRGPSTLDCSPRPVNPGAPLPPPPTDVRTSCGMMMSQTSIVSGGITMDRLVRSLEGLAGGLVNDRTGLKGPYALELNYSPDGLVAGGDRSASDLPPFVTALQEQLGLKLQPEKTMVTVLVIDSIERPSEN